MITKDLIEYIRNQTDQNTPRALIISRLAKAGWHLGDIQEGMNNVVSTDKLEPEINQEDNKNYNVDPYREVMTNDSEGIVQPSLSLNSVEVNKTEDSKINTEKEKTIPIETKKEEIIKAKKEEVAKIWTPSAIKTIEEPEVQTKNILDYEDKIEAVVKPVNTETIEVFQDELKAPRKLESNKPSLKNKVDNIDSKINKTEVIPNLIPKSKIENKSELIPPIIKSTPAISKVETIVPPLKKPEDKDSKPTTDILSKIAMISSYSNDIVSASKLKKKVLKKKKHNFLKLFLIILIIFILGGISFFFIKNYNGQAIFNSFFTKKNNEVTLLTSINNFSLLKSYKIKTEVDISLPLLTNITSSLASGKVISSNDQDWFLIDSNGMINGANKNILPLFYYDIVLKSSLLGQNIETSLNSNGEKLFINIPDLKYAFGNKAPLAGLISIPNNKIEKLKQIIPLSIQNDINKIGIAKIFLNNLFNHSFNTGTFTLFKNFMNKVSIIQKGQEDINGTGTTHYSISVDKLLMKKFLNNMSNLLVSNLSVDEKTNLKEILDSTSVNSIDIWIGNKDNNIYRYKIKLDIPLSKIINSANKAIANDKVTLSWQSTYSDLNVLNNIIMPPGPVNIDDYLKNVANVKLKNIILSFSQPATLMKKTIGNYGKKSNSKGSCSSPTSGSLFSSLGHSKNVSKVITTIADIINKIISQGNGSTSLCYSTPKAWALSSPQIIDPSYYFCTDSKGNSIIMTKPITGPVCK